jgi:molybdopterin/thiamine biosynthesis adenylyltransferase
MYDRQSFLGPHAQTYLANIRVGVIGYGGGGSHVGLQLAHIGVGHQIIFDDDKIEESNLNRLVGGWAKDVTIASKKTLIAERTIKNVLPNAEVQVVNSRWQNNPEELQKCDIVVGCVDSYLERDQLEAECRRYLIPLIDIGMDVHPSGTNEYIMSGQVILSMPGGACMRCMKFITDENLAKEAAKYGNVGGKPQVVWPNGVLASTAVGIVVDIITGWTDRKDPKIYLTYDGNLGTISSHLRLNYLPETCLHHQLTDAGEPRFKKL